MKFKFSVRRLLILMTAVAIVLGIADRMGLLGASDYFSKIIGIYCFSFLVVFFVFCMPRYLRQWREFRQREAQIQEVRGKLESEVQQKLREREKRNRIND